MNYLIFDTETSDFPRKGLSSNDPRQARICQLAWLLLDDELKEVETYNQLFKLGKETKISPGAYAAHKHTWEDCNSRGLDPRQGIDTFRTAQNKSSFLIAHNFAFDVQLLEIEQVRLQLEPNFTPFYCTMEAMTPICRLPAKWKGSSFKWPKLQEAYRHCYGKEFDGAHDALSDVRATADVFRWLVHEGYYKLPAKKEELCQAQTRTQSPLLTPTTSIV